MPLLKTVGAAEFIEALYAEPSLRSELRMLLDSLSGSLADRLTSTIRFAADRGFEFDVDEYHSALDAQVDAHFRAGGETRLTEDELLANAGNDCTRFHNSYAGTCCQTSTQSNCGGCK